MFNEVDNYERGNIDDDNDEESDREANGNGE